MFAFERLYFVGYIGENSYFPKWIKYEKMQFDEQLA